MVAQQVFSTRLSTLGVHKTFVEFELPNGRRFRTTPSKLPSARVGSA